jgi:hypothetical protein
MESSQSYFARRAGEERAAAAAATDEFAREIHLKLAQLYAERVGEDAPAEQLPPLRSVG